MIAKAMIIVIALRAWFNSVVKMKPHKMLCEDLGLKM